jgi:hypothetical protein
MRKMVYAGYIKQILLDVEKKRLMQDLHII